MDAAAITSAFQSLQNENPGSFELLVVISKAGEVLYSSQEGAVTPDQAKHILDVWSNNKAAVELGEIRYPVLKWDPLQFAAKNVGGKGSLVGSKTKAENYAVAKVSPGSPLSVIQASIVLNRWAWNVC
jgi:hypothetical protein